MSAAECRRICRGFGSDPKVGPEVLLGNEGEDWALVGLKVFQGGHRGRVASGYIWTMYDPNLGPTSASNPESLDLVLTAEPVQYRSLR